MSASTKPVAAWEDFVLRLIAIYKLAKMVVFVAIGIGLLRIMHHNVVEILMVYVIDPLHFDPENRLLKVILDEASELTAHRIGFLSFGAFFYAAVFGTEGIGLYLRKHWAEYMVLISTGSLLPIEFYEIYLQLAWWKVGVVVGNLAILVYLIHRLWLDAHNSDNPDKEDPKGPPGSGAEKRKKNRDEDDHRLPTPRVLK